MRSLRLLFLLSHDKSCATYVRAYHLSKELAVRGHAVTLMIVSQHSKCRQSTTSESGLEIVETPNFSHDILGRLTSRLFFDDGTGILDIIARIRRILHGQYDVVHTFDHSMNVAIPMYFLRSTTKTRFISDWCDVYYSPGGLRETYGYRLDRIYAKLGFPFRMYSKFIEVDLRRKADAVTVISSGMSRFAVQHGVARDKTFVVRGGADIDKVRPLAKIWARRNLGFPEDGKIVGFMGTFQGDLDIAIQSIVSVRKEIPNSYLMVVGTPREGTRRLAEELGVGEALIEVGRCSDVLLPQYLACADVLALPMRANLPNETRWPNKIGEYMACGRPMVVSNVGDVAEVVARHRIGLAVEPGVEGFAAGIKALLMRTDAAEEMGTRARELACAEYSWSLVASELEKIYLQVIASKGVERLSA